MKAWVPGSVKESLAGFFGLTKLHRRIDGLRDLLLELQGAVDKLAREQGHMKSRLALLDDDARYWESSRERWREACPDRELTWGKDISGHAFIEKVASFGVFDETKTVLELGPGYGRLLKAILESETPFAEYRGLDISPKNVDHLRQAFGSKTIQFIQGDVETCALDFGYDVFISSLTMKHLFPTFERSLARIASFANRGCMFFFDLIEGDEKYFERDRSTYIKAYSRDEVDGILSSVGLERVAFDTITHEPGHTRLLVVARKATSQAPTGAVLG